MGQLISSKYQTQTVDVDLDIGYHEVERFEEESDLHEKKKSCKKNPGHACFIPVTQFNLQHLPEGHRDQLCLDYIMTVISLTVRITGKYVSRSRPSCDYHLCNCRGKKVGSVGSGMVEWVYRKFSEMDGNSCPCPHCAKMPVKDRKKQWGKFGVVTAKHVVHDGKESVHITVHVDYNKDTDRSTCPKLYGVGVRESIHDIVKDESEIYVVSHDREVCLKLEERIECYGDLHEKVKHNHFYRGNRGFNKRPIVCVSHPHGMSKHVSIGEFRSEQKHWPFKWRYTTPTCPGSSGAPVFRLGEKWDMHADTGYMTYHSMGGLENGENESGRYGWWR